MQESTRNLLLFRGRGPCPHGGQFAVQILRDDGGQLNDLELCRQQTMMSQPVAG